MQLFIALLAVAAFATSALAGPCKHSNYANPAPPPDYFSTADPGPSSSLATTYSRHFAYHSSADPTPSSSLTGPASSSPTTPATSGCVDNYYCGTQTGQGTYYGPGQGACGHTSASTDLIVAVDSVLFDGYPGATTNPNNNPICGKRIQASYNGKSVTVTVVDRCTGCKPTDLDFSPTAFEALADKSVGRIRSGMTWHWV